MPVVVNGAAAVAVDMAFLGMGYIPYTMYYIRYTIYGSNAVDFFYVMMVVWDSVRRREVGEISWYIDIRSKRVGCDRESRTRRSDTTRNSASGAG